jgi:hypothetical protein
LVVAVAEEEQKIKIEVLAAVVLVDLEPELD